jgi:hypothetical protein
MKKKTLTEEINRMLILMESPANKWVMAAEGLVKVLKEIPGLSNVILNSLDSLSNAVTSKEVIELLITLAKVSPKLKDDILKTVYETLNPQVKDVVSNAIVEIKKGLDEGVSKADVDEFIDDTIKSLDSAVDDIEVDLMEMIKDDIVKQVDKYTPKPKPEIPVDEVSDLPRLLRDIENIVPGNMTTADKLLLTKNLPFREMRAYINKELNERLGKIKDKEQKIAGLIRRAAEDLKLGGGSSAEIDETLMKTIAAEIDGLRQSENFAKDVVFDNLENALRIGLGDRAADASTIMTKVKEFDALNPNAQLWWDEFIKDFYIQKMITLPRNQHGRVELLKWMWNFFERSFGFIFSGQLRKFEEIYKSFIMNKSLTKKTLGLWLYFTFYSKIFLPGVYAIFKSMVYGLNRQTSEDDAGDVYSDILLKDIQEGFITYREDYDEEIFDFFKMKGFNDKEIDELRTAIKILYPFNVYWDDMLDAWKYVVSGKFMEGLRNQSQDMRDRAEAATGEVLDSAQTVSDTLQQRVRDAMPPIDSIPALRVDTTGNTRIRTRTPLPLEDN